MADNRIQLVRTDITRLAVDAIVNAANTSLLGGGGVDGAIHRAGGKAILEDCMRIRQEQGGCPVGEAVITTAGNMPSKYVIHTVGPVWSQRSAQRAAVLLSYAYRNSLRLAAAKEIRSIAFPNISTGIYHFPKPEAARIALSTVQEFLAGDTRMEQVLFACFDEENFAIYEKMLASPEC